MATQKRSEVLPIHSNLDNDFSKEWTFRRTRPDDIDAILRLLKVCMPHSPVPRSKEFWQWKHFRNPFGVSPGLVAIKDQEIVGLRTFMRWLWRFRGAECKAVRAVDTVTHPDYRGIGLFSKLTLSLLEQMQAEEIRFVFNTPNRSSLPGYLKMGWQPITRVPVWIRPIRPFRSLSRLIRGNKMIVQERPLSMQALFEHPKLEDFLTTAANHDRRFQTVRSVKYLKWRYAEIPEFAYEAVWKFEDQASALLIYRQKVRKGFHELSLCEILTSQNRSGIELGRKLVLDLVKNTKADYLIASAATDTPEMTVIRSCGFIPLPALGPILTVKLLREFDDRMSPVKWANWRASLGDLELF